MIAKTFAVAAIFVATFTIRTNIAPAADAKPDAKKITYQDDIAPIFRESCFGCHNPDKAKGGLNLTTFATMMQGGSSGTAVEPGDSGNSYLFQLVNHESEPHMPLNSAKLPDEKLALIRKFIEGGALESSGSKPAEPKKERAELKLSSVPNAKPDGPPPMPPRLSLEPMLHSRRAGAITALAVSPWAPLVAVSGQQQVLLYSTDNFQLLGVLPFLEGTVHVLRFSRNGKLLLAGGGHEAKSGRVVLWDITTGKRIAEIGDEYDVVLAADISPDQSLVALGGPSKVVRIFSTATGEVLQQIKKHTDWITALEFSPDNVLLATGDRSGEVIVWEAAQAREYLTLHGHTAGVTSVSWQPDGNQLATAGDDSSIRLWEMENGKQTKTWNAHGGVQQVQFTHDGQLLTCGRDHLVKLWKLDGKQQGKDMPLADMAMHAATTSVASRIIGGDWAGEVRVWNTADAKELGSLSANPPTLGERLALAQAKWNEREAERKRLAAAAETSKSQADKLSADLTGARKLLADNEAIEKANQADLANLQKLADQSAAEMSAIQSGLAIQEAAATALTEALAKAQQAAEKLPSNAELADAVTKIKSITEAVSAEIESQKKTLDLKTHQQAETEKKMAELRAGLEKLALATQTARQQIDSLSPAVETAAKQSAADRQAADQVTATVDSLQKELQHWNDEIEFAKSTRQ